MVYLLDQSDSEFSVDFIRMVTVRSPESTSGSEAERSINSLEADLLYRHVSAALHCTFHIYGSFRSVMAASHHGEKESKRMR